MMILKIKIKTVYGNDLIYPANETAELFCRLIGKKTFNRDDLEAIRALGYVIEQVNAYDIFS